MKRGDLVRVKFACSAYIRDYAGEIGFVIGRDASSRSGLLFVEFFGRARLVCFPEELDTVADVHTGGGT